MNQALFIECLKGDTIKREYTKSNAWKWRDLHIAFPFSYGFIPNTEAEDGDEVDVVVFGDVPGLGLLYSAQLVGCLHMEDNGVVDNKEVYVMPGYHFSDEDISRMVSFFGFYKKGVEVGSFELNVKGLEMAYGFSTGREGGKS